ncbi:MAG TPA: acyl-CoA dehydrogenase [Micromonosporaceae bacterium]|nr:acyl-CoA dehydrogenase [Micromonosporaceae bacterium]
MDVTDRLTPVLASAHADAPQVDATGVFPQAAVSALRESGLLGLSIPVEAGGLGGGPKDLVEMTSKLAAVCGSTAMVYLMHISAVMAAAAAPPAGRPDLVRQLASGEKLGTLAFSEAGSRSHFWAPVSQGQTDNGGTHVKTRKSWVTSAGHADVYLVSTLTSPELVSAEAPVPIDVYAIESGTAGVQVAGQFRGMGLRGNASAPMTFDLTASAGDRVGQPGTGFALMLNTVMPWFNLGNAAVSLGLSQAAVDAAITHTSGARFEHLGESLAELPTIRAQLAKMALELAAIRSYVDTAAGSIAAPDDSTTLHVLGVKAVANDAALRITDTAMRVCGGAAFSEHLQLERFFRDARAGGVMAPTADVLYDFYGKAITGQPLF